MVSNDTSNFRMAPTLQPAIQFEPLAEAGDYPPPYHTLDSLLTEFYQWYYGLPVVHNPDSLSNWVNYDLPYSLVESFAQAILRTHYYPFDLWNQYFRTAKQPRVKQFERYDSAKEQGKVWDAIPYVNPGYVTYIYTLQNQIKQRMPDIWYFLLDNQFIVVGKVIKTYRDWIDPDLQWRRPVFSECKIMSDIKGNLSTQGPIVVFGSNLEPDEKYLIPIAFRSDKSDPYRYRINSNFAPVKIQEGVVQNTEGKLLFERTLIPLSTLQDSISTILKQNIPEVRDEKSE